MLKSMLEGKVNTNQELKDFIDKNMQEFSELHRHSVNSDLIDRVTQIFEEKEGNWIQQILFLSNSEEYKNVKELTEKVGILEQFCLLAEKEMNLGIVPMLYKFSTLDEMVEVYYRTVFGLRRVEIGIGEKSSELLMALWEKWDFSSEYVVMVLKNILIRNQLGMYLKLAYIFAENGQMDFYKRFLEEGKNM